VVEQEVALRRVERGANLMAKGVANRRREQLALSSVGTQLRPQRVGELVLARANGLGCSSGRGRLPRRAFLSLGGLLPIWLRLIDVLLERRAKWIECRIRRLRRRRRRQRRSARAEDDQQSHADGNAKLHTNVNANDVPLARLWPVR